MPDVAWSSYDNIRDFRDIKALGVTGDINTTLPDSVTKELRRAYFSAVTWVDSLIGEVVSEIDSLGLSDSTIISFIGDHGWMLGEHGEWGKKTNFELATHAPLMIHIPGRTDGGIKSDQLVEFVDIFPTIAEASGLGQLPLCPEDSSNVLLCREGTSLLPLLDSPNIPLRTAAFSQYPSTGRVMGYSIRTDQYRYTEWPIFRYDPEYTPNWNQLSGVELYDHETDPDENYNVADEVSYKTIREVLSTQLHAGWRNAVVNPVDRRTIQMERLSRLLTQLTT
jgi:iduronate 2-sulfatase